MQGVSSNPILDGNPSLAQQQYRDDLRLRARFELHKEFSTSQTDYLTWIFNHIKRCDPVRILDLGCGPGYLWQHNAPAIPDHWSPVLADLSEGMLSAAASQLTLAAVEADLLVSDGERLPFSSLEFDAVVALHVLHLFEDAGNVLSELKRVLKPDGCLLVATNGERHMLELRETLKMFNVRTAYFRSGSAFSLKNGGAQLLELFDHVECIHFNNTLEVARVQPLLNYARSGVRPADMDAQREALRNLAGHWEGVLEREGSIRIETEAGLFIAC